jgi:uncharacterized protein YbjT (DUF2867 family)
MNDNFTSKAQHLRYARDMEAAQSAAIEEVRSVAARAVTEPESLTMGEIQEVGWAFLMASKEITRTAKPV